MKSALIAIALSPLLINLVVRTYAWLVLLGDTGVINNWLRALGLIGGPLPLSGNLFSVVVGLVHICLPLMALSLLGVLERIDRTLEDAADSLGASRWRILRRIILPLSLPGIGAGSLLVFTFTISAFITPSLLGGNRVSTISTLIYEKFTFSANWPVGATLGRGAAGDQLRRGRAARPAVPGGVMLDRVIDAIGWLVTLFILGPLIVIIGGSFTETPYVAFPPAGFTLRWYDQLLHRGDFLQSFLVSVLLGGALLRRRDAAWRRGGDRAASARAVAVPAVPRLPDVAARIADHRHRRGAAAVLLPDRSGRAAHRAADRARADHHPLRHPHRRRRAGRARPGASRRPRTASAPASCARCCGSRCRRSRHRSWRR